MRQTSDIVFWHCNVQRGNPSENNAHQFEKLKPESKGVRSAIYKPPVTLLSPPRSFAPELGLGDPWVRHWLRSGSCHHPTAATKCNVQRGNPSENNAHQFEKLKPKSRGVRSLYINHHSPIHQEMVSLICRSRRFTNVTTLLPIGNRWKIYIVNQFITYSNIPRTHPYINKEHKKSDLLHDRSLFVIWRHTNVNDVTFCCYYYRDVA